MINMPAPEFMEKLHFDLIDLEHNRRGELSPKQLDRIQNERDYSQHVLDQPQGSTNVLMIFFVLMLVGVFVFMWVMAGEQFTQLIESLGPAALPLGGMGVLLVIVYLLYARRSMKESQRMFREMHASNVKRGTPEVQSIRGRAWTEGSRASRDSRRYLYFLFVDNPEARVQISIGERGHGAFDRGTVYRVYYYEESGLLTFLSAEPA